MTGLNPGTSYSFQVVAANGFGVSDPSTSTASSVTSAASAPSAPTGVAAEWTSGTSVVRVAWRPAVANGSPVTNYTVIASPGAVQRTTTTSSTDFSGLDPSVAYTFRVRGTNAIGDSPLSEPSNEASLATSAPAAPTEVEAVRQSSVKTGALRSRTAKIQWTPGVGGSRVTDYKVTLFRIADDSQIQLVEEQNVDLATEATFRLISRGKYYAVVAATNALGDAASQPSDPFPVWDESEARNWQFNSSLQQFLAVRANNTYPYSFDSDGCSFPDTFPDQIPVIGGEISPAFSPLSVKPITPDLLMHASVTISAIKTSGTGFKLVKDKRLEAT